jgi:hypothetical protein
MRHWMRLAVAATVLAVGCGPTDKTDVAQRPAHAFAKPDTFPALYQTAYRAEAIAAGSDPAQAVPVTIYRDSGKTRMELNAPGIGQGALVTDPATGDIVFLMSQAGQQVAVKLDAADALRPAEADWANAAGAVLVGACAGAGEVGAEWRLDVADGVRTACVTGDGIILRAKSGERVTWETKTISRGPQDLALFAPPPGTKSVDVRDMMSAVKGLTERAAPQ